MINVNYFIPKIDKLKHFYLWEMFFILSAIFTTVICRSIDVSVWIGIIVSYLLTVLTALRKEWKDSKSEKNKSELADFVYSVLAPTLSVILLYICLN